MGYSTDMAGRLCCDKCGQSGKVRKRTCTATVLADSLRSTTRHTLHYCYPPALCPDCYRELGGAKQIHKDCAEGAARSQRDYDRIEELLDAGEHLVVAAYGSWHESVPDGWTGVLFRGRDGERSVLVPASDYDHRVVKFSTLSSFTNAKEWNQ